MRTEEQVQSYLANVVLPLWDEQMETGSKKFWGTTPIEMVRDVLDYILDEDSDEDPCE